MLIHPYQKEWPQHFQSIADILQSALQGLNVKIEHVGSTAVPGLAAKPIIDIDIIFPAEVEFQVIVEALSGLGYYHNGDQGIPQREVFKRKASQQSSLVLDEIPHHLYACPCQSEEWQRHVMFRDYLRGNEWARTAYQELKLELAEEANQDRKIYAALKEEKGRELILSILEKARQKITKDL